MASGLTLLRSPALAIETSVTQSTRPRLPSARMRRTYQRAAARTYQRANALVRMGTRTHVHTPRKCWRRASGRAGPRRLTIASDGAAVGTQAEGLVVEVGLVADTVVRHRLVDSRPSQVVPRSARLRARPRAVGSPTPASSACPSSTSLPAVRMCRLSPRTARQPHSPPPTHPRTAGRRTRAEAAECMWLRSSWEAVCTRPASTGATAVRRRLALPAHPRPHLIWSSGRRLRD